MPDTLFLRNVDSGEIREVVPFGEDHLKIRFERQEDGHRFLWEETSAADADPEKHAHPDEVAARRRWGVEPLSFVKSDGTPTSRAAHEAVAKRDPGLVPVRAAERDPAEPAKGARPPKQQSKRSAASKQGGGE